MVVTNPIQARRVSQIVAAELRARILRGEYDNAAGVPPEPEFAQQLGVSRYHLREALRLLEQDGLVDVRPGRNGGIFLTVPQDDALSRTFAGILSRKATTLADLFMARLVIEPSAAEIAATAATNEDFANLHGWLDKQEATTRYEPELNSQFHIAVTAAAHNDTLLLMMRSVESLIRGLDRAAGGSLALDAVEPHRAHRAIVRALEARDGSRARDALRLHLLGFEGLLVRLGHDLSTTRISDLMGATAGNPLPHV